ncbi:MAG: hypothetical protein AB7N65_18675 [Vicinamibacterales bacterium]
MALVKRGEVWYFTKRINGQRFRASTGFADRKSAERRAAEIEVDIRSGIHGWKSDGAEPRLEWASAELRGMVGGVPEDIHPPEVREEP